MDVVDPTNFSNTQAPGADGPSFRNQLLAYTLAVGELKKGWLPS
jgi:hypothetical protein